MSEKLWKNPSYGLEDQSDEFLPVATLQIYEYIKQYLVDSRDGDTFINRASEANGCYLKSWYKRTGVEGDPLTPRRLNNFINGDIGEMVGAYFVCMACTGLGRLYSEVSLGHSIKNTFTIQNGFEIKQYNQWEVKTDCAGIVVVGHPDGFGKRNTDGKWELIEFKTYSNYSFSDFKAEGPGDYMKQAHVLMMSDKARELGVDGVRFFGLRKETGHLWDSYHPFDPKVFEQVCKEFKLRNQEEKPARPYHPEDELYYKKPTGRKVLPFPCNGYCPYSKKCFPTAKIEFKKGQFGGMSPKFYL